MYFHQFVKLLCDFFVPKNQYLFRYIIIFFMLTTLFSNTFDYNCFFIHNSRLNSKFKLGMKLDSGRYFKEIFDTKRYRIQS